MEHKEYRKLHAEWYDLVSGQADQSKEIDYWAKSIDDAGEPALELGSGTGRVLVPLLQRGYRVVGIDTSGDMMARCVAKCRENGLRPELHEQSMLNFHLDDRFGLIFLDSGGLGLFTSDHDIEAVFQSVIGHLKPGGVFIYEFQPVPISEGANAENGSWGRWEGDWLKGADGVVISWRRRRKYDPTTHIWTWLFVIEKFVNGALVETEADERTGRYFSVDEATRFAVSAGFGGSEATDWLSTEPPRVDSKVITVRCRKPL